MSERIRGSYDDALYKSTYTLLYFTTLLSPNNRQISLFGDEMTQICRRYKLLVNKDNFLRSYSAEL